MKAYKVENPHDGLGMVVLAETASKARSAVKGTDIFHDCGFIDILVHRAPEFDSYDHDPTMKELVEGHGWWLGCDWCQKAVADHNDERIWNGDDCVWCGPACKRRRIDADVARKAAATANLSPDGAE